MSDVDDLELFYKNRKYVESALLSGVVYLDDSWVLFIQFQDGAIYKYESVPPRVYDELLAAPSKGKYFGALILKVYNYRRLQ